MGEPRKPRLLAPTERGGSCAQTILAALRDTDLKPEVLHVVGASEAELSLDFEALAEGLPPGARVVLIGPHATAAGAEPSEELLGPVDRFGLQVSVFPQAYQRYTVVCHNAEAPQLVVLFHPGLDIHYFTWYPCLKLWADSRVPVLVTAYRRPKGLGETPALVNKLLGTLLGTGGGAGMWVIEEENPYCIEEASFNAGYFVTLGSQGALPTPPEEMYFSVFQALRQEGYPFAPRVGYLDVGSDEGQVGAGNMELLAAIAEGAVRAAKAGEDACDDDTAVDFAKTVLEQTLGPGTGDIWQKASFQRKTCPNCGEGYDSAASHLSICPAVGVEKLHAGDHVCLANLHKEEYNGREGVLQSFDRLKQRWVVRMGEKDALFKPVNLRKKAA